MAVLRADAMCALSRCMAELTRWLSIKDWYEGIPITSQSAAIIITVIASIRVKPRGGAASGGLAAAVKRPGREREGISSGILRIAFLQRAVRSGPVASLVRCGRGIG